MSAVGVQGPAPGRSPDPAADGAAALSLVRVSAGYGPYRALFEVSLAVGPGEVLALLGPNGAGKSTVARVASGLVPVTSGQVMLGGADVTGQPAWRLARAGVVHVPEGRGVFSRLTVEENLVVGLRRRAGRHRVGAALGDVYDRFPVLAERRRQRAGTLSGGQQRLLSLAKVVALDPAPLVLVADELSLGLAPGVVHDVYAALAELRDARSALVVVEQQVDRALGLATRAVVLDHGAVAYSGAAAGAGAALEGVLSARGERSTGRVQLPTRPGPTGPAGLPPSSEPGSG